MTDPTLASLVLVQQYIIEEQRKQLEEFIKAPNSKHLLWNVEIQIAKNLFIILKFLL